MVDVSKIRVGDKIGLAEVVVERLGERDRAYLIRVKTGPYLVWISADLITSHTPAPKEWKVGDKCRLKADEREWDVVAPARNRNDGVAEVTLWRDAAGYLCVEADEIEPVE